MRIDPQSVRNQIAALILSYPEVGEDEVLRADMIGAEVEDFDKLLTHLVRSIEDARALSDGTDLRIKELQARQGRFDRRVEAYRSLIEKLMLAADLQRRELPEATLSIGRRPPKVIGEPDIATLPDHLIKIERKPDRAAIKTALEAGETVSGCSLSNGSVALTIRVK